MCQRFYADKSNTHLFKNGAIGYRTGAGPFDCLGPFAKVQNCPIDKTALRLTCYATDHPDSAFSVPACTRYRGKYIRGFFYCNDGEIDFVPFTRFFEHLGINLTALKIADLLIGSK